MNTSKRDLPILLRWRLPDADFQDKKSHHVRKDVVAKFLSLWGQTPENENLLCKFYLCSNFIFILLRI